jgi:hypothetical protein
MIHVVAATPINRSVASFHTYICYQTLVWRKDALDLRKFPSSFDVSCRFANVPSPDLCREVIDREDYHTYLCASRMASSSAFRFTRALCSVTNTSNSDRQCWCSPTYLGCTLVSHLVCSVPCTMHLDDLIPFHSL